jgi:hypothetical protein
MARILTAILAILALSTQADAVTLTITPDKQTYQVGETITLNVFGDAEGTQGAGIFGRILFDTDIADYVGSNQEPLTSFNGGITWFLSPLSGGNGFGDAFDQFVSLNPHPVDGPLSASVTLLATAPGILAYSWDSAGTFRLDFFGLTNAPGGSVTIVPEPSTGALVASGMIVAAAARRAGRRRKSRSRTHRGGCFS